MINVMAHLIEVLSRESILEMMGEATGEDKGKVLIVQEEGAPPLTAVAICFSIVDRVHWSGTGWVVTCIDSARELIRIYLKCDAFQEKEIQNQAYL